MTGTEDIIIHPRRGRREPAIPAAGLLLVTPAEARRGHRLLAESGGDEKFLYNSRLTVAQPGNFFIAGPAVGAPMAAMTLEKLIALGARQVVLYGWCGAVDPLLHVGDLVVGAAPVSGEGTSRYYRGCHPPLPSAALTAALTERMDGAGYGWQKATIWTTDAPYREARSQISTLAAEQGVRAVDMEYAALCAVSRFRGIDFAAVFLVSDELHAPQWRHGFRRDCFRDTNRKLVELLANGLGGIVSDG